MPPAWEFFIATVLGIRDLMLQALVLLGIIKARTDTTAQEHYPFEIATLTSEQTQYERSVGTGFPKVIADIAELRSYITSQDSGLLAAIGGIPDLVVPPLTPVTLPTVPPTGYGGATAENVWGYPISQQNADGTAYEAMAEEWLYNVSHTLALISATDGFGDNRQPWYRLVFGGLATGYSYGYNWNIYSHTRPVSPDFTAALPDDTVLSFLQRTQPSGGWSGQGPSGAAQTDIAWKRAVTAQVDIWWRTAFQLPAVALPAGAPIWPGIAAVTLGDTVPAVASTVLELPMDGIIWLTTSYPPARARWGAAPYYSVYHTGRLAFVTDNGDLEPFQYMGWQNAVYVPQTMKRAAGVVVFLEANIEGAITPWDISV